MSPADPEPAGRARNRIATVGGLVLGALIGLVVGTLGAFVQAARLEIAGVLVPWGAAFMVVCLLAVVRGVAWATGGRSASWLAFAGWLAATVVMAGEWPWGDVVLSGGGRQFGYLVAGVVLGSAAASLPVPRRDAS